MNPPAKAGDTGSIPGSERSPGEGNGNPLHYSCLGNYMDRGAWRATVHGVTKELAMTQQQNDKVTWGDGSDSEALGQDLKLCISNKLPGDTHVSSPFSTLSCKGLEISVSHMWKQGLESWGLYSFPGRDVGRHCSFLLVYSFQLFFFQLQSVCVCVCVCSVASVISDSLQLYGLQPARLRGILRQEYWTGFPCPPPGDLPWPRDQLASPVSLALQADSLKLSRWEAPSYRGFLVKSEETEARIQRVYLNHWDYDLTVFFDFFEIRNLI